MSETGRRIQIQGVVQGVGFRPWVYRLARESGVAGSVRNGGDGVTIEVFGPDRALDLFLGRLRGPAPPAAAVRSIQWRPIASDAPPGDFAIAVSEPSRERRVSIPPDLATCPACLEEVLDPADRRHRYPFTNCTDCGPRFTIARDVPYDRRSTTMASFAMCPDCQREYDDPGDRRFHAQPNACPVCGPRLQLITADGEAMAVDDPLRYAATALLAGLVVAVKGLGGFHLACDATLPEAVARLRLRKRRDAKPFAVMVRDLAAAEALADLRDDERTLLTSVERPIVLARQRRGSPLAAEVAPGLPLVGLLLPYTPLHHLLLAAAGRPLVMTSANLSDEPIAFRDGEARERLQGIADLLLLHDREIETPCEDSVAQIIAGAPTVLRRSRGWVPRPVAVPRPFPQPVLACGGDLKNAFCFGVGGQAWLGPHLGDLEALPSYEAYVAAIDRLQRFLRITPEVVAYDLHPSYLSTRYATARPEPVKLGVQHHHAHVASCMAEHGLEGPVFGVAFDGTGYGLDGTAWGGEVLLATYGGFRRLATLRPIALAGGEAAIREPWRLALAVVRDAYEGGFSPRSLPFFAAVEPYRLAAVDRLLAADPPRAHGAGRWFDAVGALALGLHRSRFEGEVALRWNLTANPEEAGLYPFALDRAGEPWQIDLRPMVRAVVEDLWSGRATAAMAARFHNTLAAAVGDVLRQAAAEHGTLPVALTGGCFANAFLTERLEEQLFPDFSVFLHRQVPPGDGGLALGQAVVAAAAPAAAAHGYASLMTEETA